MGYVNIMTDYNNFCSTVHQHNVIGQGKVPWDEVFQTLRDVSFDGVVSVCIFGWHEKADEYNRAALARLTEELCS